VAEVTAGGPAEAAGIRPGDVITELGGRPVVGPDELATLVRDRAPGDRVEVRYRRGSEERSATATLGTRPDA
jgi:S1-C subfamily serine protease